jgi:hypothetical protein
LLNAVQPSCLQHQLHGTLVLCGLRVAACCHSVPFACQLNGPNHRHVTRAATAQQTYATPFLSDVETNTGPQAT